MFISTVKVRVDKKQLKTKTMLTLNTNNPNYIWLSFQVRIASYLDHVKLSIKDIFPVKEYLKKNIVNRFNDATIGITERTKEVKKLTPLEAKIELGRFIKDREFFERFKEDIDHYHSSHFEFKIAIKALIVASYKYEARLHTIAYSDVPVTETPRYIKQGLSEMSKKVTANLHSNNAFS